MVAGVVLCVRAWQLHSRAPPDPPARGSGRHGATQTLVAGSGCCHRAHYALLPGFCRHVTVRRELPPGSERRRSPSQARGEPGDERGGNSCQQGEPRRRRTMLPALTSPVGSPDRRRHGSLDLPSEPRDHAHRSGVDSPAADSLRRGREVLQPSRRPGGSTGQGSADR